MKDFAKQDIALPSLDSLSGQDIAPHASSEAQSSSQGVPQNASSNIDSNSLDLMGEIANASWPKTESSTVEIRPLHFELKTGKAPLASNESMPDSMDEVEPTSLQLDFSTSKDSLLNAMSEMEATFENRKNSADSRTVSTNESVVVIADMVAMDEKIAGETCSSASEEMAPTVGQQDHKSAELYSSSDCSYKEDITTLGPASKHPHSVSTQTENGFIGFLMDTEVEINKSHTYHTEVENTNTKEALAASEPYLRGNDPDGSSSCSSGRGWTASLHSEIPASSADSLELPGASCFFISDYNELMEEMSQNDIEPTERTCSGKLDSWRSVTQKGQQEKKEIDVSFETSNVESALTTTSDELAAVDRNRQDNESVLSDLSKLLIKPSKLSPTQSSDMCTLTLFTEEDIGVATDSAPEHVVVLNRDSQKLSERMRGMPRQTVNGILKPVLVSKMKHEHLPRKTSKNVCKIL